MQFEKAYSFLIEKLESGLPSYLHYHSPEHTKEVVVATDKLANAEHISERDLIIVKTAALFHDCGFLETYSDHEEISCDMARKWLPQFEYSTDEIEEICSIILATKIPQTPHNHLEEILADADLDYLGRDDFFTIGNRLYEELAMFGIVHNEDDWNRLQIKFLENHHYFTPTAIRLRKAQKEAHLQSIKSQLNHHNE